MFSRNKIKITGAVLLLSVLFVVLEMLKHLLFPSLEYLYSHLVTFGFIMIYAAVVVYIIRRIDLRYARQMSKKQLETSKLGQALLSSEDRYRAVFENSSSQIMLLDGETWEIADFNRKACESLGYSRFEFTRLSIKDLDMAPFQEVRGRLERLSKAGASETYETRYRMKNGESVEVLANIVNLTIAGKKFFLCVAEDLTERKRIQAKTVEHYEFMNTLMETIPSPVFYKDRQGKYLGCNRAFEELFGISRKEIVGKSVFDISPKEIAEEYFKMDNELFSNPGRQVYEWKVNSKKHGVRDVIFNKATFVGLNGEVAGIVGAIMDITDRKMIELELQRGRDATSEHNRILIGWTSPEMLYDPDFEEIVTKITKTVSEVLKVERVSFWLFNTEYSKLYCTELFERGTGMRLNGGELDVKQYPAYFKSLREQRVIVSNNSQGDPRYSELIKDYMRPNGISSTIDVPVFVSGELLGVICLEHKGRIREWTPEEQNFAISVGNIFSLALEISRHKKLDKSVRSARDNFVNIVEKLPYPVLIADMRGVVKYVNAACESFFGPKVKDMLGAEFPYPLPKSDPDRIDYVPADGFGKTVEISTVQTRWDREPARLVSLYEKTSK